MELARHADDWGYNRYWLAEHHGMPGIASAATAVLIGQVAAVTQRMRVGAGGIMLPNHSPLVIAEQFGTLEALFPGRIDLGLGRAPGSDQQTARALRRDLASSPDAFPQDVLELMAYFEGRTDVQAVPGNGLPVPIWILGSSLFGASLAAQLGLPYAFASHFAPEQMMPATSLYRRTFKPSRYLETPWVALGYNVLVAESDDQARYLATSWQQAFTQLRLGRPGQLPPPQRGYLETLPPVLCDMLRHVLSCSAIGTLDSVARQMRAFIADTQADELILTTNTYDPAARLASYEAVAQLIGDTP